MNRSCAGCLPCRLCSSRSTACLALPPPSSQSTAVRKAAREAPAAGPNGVVCTTVDDVSAFSAQLTTLLEEAPAAAAGRKHEPTTSWRLLAPDLRKAAMEFR